MIWSYLLFLATVALIDAAHFNGGTMRWVPIDPRDNSTMIAVNLIQTYFWSYPEVLCANDVPISTPSRRNEVSYIECVADCASDGGYSNNPVKTLTDCVSFSSAVSVMKSERLMNVTLANNTHFYAAFAASAWRSLNSPSQSGRPWSIVSYVDLRKRPDGLINTPPIAHMVSPQYTIVNRTTLINIPVSDPNLGDDIRCRWSRYINGYRRRRLTNNDRASRSRRMRSAVSTSNCNIGCFQDCPCNSTTCHRTSCVGEKCASSPFCSIADTSMPPIIETDATNLDEYTVDDMTTEEYTTPTTSTTSRTTYSFPNRQPVDECGGVCYPTSVPIKTTLSNCTLSFRGLVPDTWYAVALQIEDFIDSTSQVPLSSVPLQFLIYVMPEPACTTRPVILPVQDCLEALVGNPRGFDVVAQHSCDPNRTTVLDILISKSVSGLQPGSTKNSTTDPSIAYKTFTWTPQVNQLGAQELCFIAYTSDQLQSEEYCVTYTVRDTTINCTTTTSTTTTSTTTLTTTTSSSTSSSRSTSTTLTTASTSTSTTTTTRTTITTTSTATTTTTSTTSVTTPTFSLTTSIAIDSTPSKTPSWGLIAGLSSLILPLGLCSACCLYRLLWSPAARRRRSEQADDDEEKQHPIPQSYSLINSETNTRTTSSASSRDTSKASCSIETPSKTYRVYNVESTEWQVESQASMMSVSSGSILQREYLRGLAAKGGETMSVGRSSRNGNGGDGGEVN